MHASPSDDTVVRQGARTITLGWLAYFFVALLAFVGFLEWSAATTRLDRLVHDSWVRLQQRDAPEDIVIAAIDSPSLEQVGRWPWPREIQTRIFDVLQRHGARAVVVDVIYTEASRDRSIDEGLAAAIGEIPVSVLPVLLEGGIGRSAGDNLPLPVLARVATDLGHVTLPIDSDGIVRRVQLMAGFRRAHWPSLSLAMHYALDPAARHEPLPGRRADVSAQAENVWVGDHEVLIPFYGPAGTFDEVSVADLLRGRVSRSAIENKVVMLGLTSTGLGDVVPTPVSAQNRPLPGIEVHANILAALWDDRLVVAAPVWDSLLVATALLPLLLLLYSRSPPQWSLFIALGGALLPIIISAVVYARYSLWFAPISVSIAIISSYLAWSRHRLAFVNRFLARENALLAPHVPQRNSEDLTQLAGFFEHASRHLPIRGWRFSVAGETHSGGEAIPAVPADRVGVGWRFRRGVHTRRYNTPGRLVVAVKLNDESQAGPIKDYIDSLGRIRSRERQSAFGGTIERLQRNAELLSVQLQWLRGVKVFSETVLSGSPMGFAVWNPAGEMIRGNALIESYIRGVGQHTALIDFLHAIEPNASHVDLRRRMESLTTRGEEWQLAYESAGGQELIIVMSALGDSLSSRLICASILDVTAMRSAERARAEMVDYLSHDLRSPLISALYEVEADDLWELTPASETDVSQREQDNRDARRRIAANINRSLKMMDDLLHVARADSLDGSRFRELLFNDVVDNALDQMQPQAAGRNIHLSVDTADDELWLNGDASSLERAVCNIVGNAIKYSPDGSHVRLSLRQDAERQHVVLIVSDDGVGIAPEALETLFSRFRRDARVEGKIQGIGLGLALVSRVVAQHGGEVKAVSPGQGTDIIMRLPLAEIDNAAEFEREG